MFILYFEFIRYAGRNSRLPMYFKKANDSGQKYWKFSH